jgi:hypothetical protein
VGVALVNGSGGRRKKEVRALYGCRPLVPAVPPKTNDPGWGYEPRLKGTPLVSARNTTRD